MLFALLLVGLFILTHSDSDSADLAPAARLASTPAAGAGRTALARRRPDPPRRARGWRVFVFFSSAVLLTGLVSMLFADLLWRTGWTTSSTDPAWCCSSSCSCSPPSAACTASSDSCCGPSATGAASRAWPITAPAASPAPAPPWSSRSTTRKSPASARACAPPTSRCERTGQLERFDFFILSDSTDPDKWIEEERRWFELIRDLDALGRIYYRRRVVNEGKKSGNIRDFLNTWGRRYRYFIVFDADSVMRGETVVDLVKLMEAHPHVGLIQTVPALVNAESLFGRIQQFANRLYAPIFIAGLNFWAQGFGNYWGHNAIIRTEPFMQCCDLPQIAGRQALRRPDSEPRFRRGRAAAQGELAGLVRLRPGGQLRGGAAGMIENARRDRRWCQGNMQHGVVLFARGLRGISRIHLLLGIFGYLASPLWLLFLLTFNWALWFKGHTGLSDITVRAFTPFIKLTGTEHAFLIFVICMAVLFLPKVLALLDLAWTTARRRAFGGLRHAAAGAVAETVFSAFHAPLQMLWHSKFVATILLGMGVHWGPQKRTADGIAWSEAVRASLAATRSSAWCGARWSGAWTRPTFWWFVPVVAGMVLSIPFSVLTSRSSLGRARAPGLVPHAGGNRAAAGTGRACARAWPRCEQAGETAPRPPDSGLAEAVLDPYVNAIHVSLLRERAQPRVPRGPRAAGRRQTRSARAGREAARPGTRSLAAGGEAPGAVRCRCHVLGAHRQAWLRSGETLAPWWQTAIRQYAD